MADIQLRFDKDMLTLTAPLAVSFAKLGVPQQDLEFLNLIEPESIRDNYRLQMVTGAQCLVANTAGITPARLMHNNLEARGVEIATAALTIAAAAKPQHILVELAPCELPLDDSSKNSLKEYCDQYARTAAFFTGLTFDAFFLNEFNDLSTLKCALIGLRKKTEKPIFASIGVDANGTLASGKRTIEEAAAMCEEYEANVFGIRTACSMPEAAQLAKRAAAACNIPLLCELVVAEVNEKQGRATDNNPYYCADTMIEAATTLRANGVQFLRAGGMATPAYTAVLAAATTGFDVVL